MWTDLLQTHGYWLLAVGCLLEGETLLILAGYAAHRGLLDPVAVVGIAVTAGFAGDQGWFWLGRWRGRAVLARWPKLAAPAARVNALIDRWHEALIIGVRFAYGLRIAGPLLMGMSPLSAWRFAAFNAIGALLWAIVVAAVGWVFGAAAQAWLGELRAVEGWVFGAAAVLAIVIVWARRHRWRGDAADEGSSSR